MNVESLSSRVNFVVGLTVLTMGYVGTLLGVKILFGL
jgi:hypothetical protein